MQPVIRENVREILKSLPCGVDLVAAAKTRSPREVLEAVEAGVKIIGENYIQDAERALALIGNKVQWHFIGRLQRNKVGKAVRLFDMIETVDSEGIAAEIDMKCRETGKVMPVLIEVNSGREKRKSGVNPDDAENLITAISCLLNIRIMGLMTMGPALENPEEARPYFTETKLLFERIKKLRLPNIEMRYLSMGMTDTYRVAVEEGANMVRIGTKVFGGRP